MSDSIMSLETLFAEEPLEVASAACLSPEVLPGRGWATLKSQCLTVCLCMSDDGEVGSPRQGRVSGVL